ncbi:ubiquitin-conjugating enzyme/RWD-like protein, partial [Entophlyctis helioformis]
MAARRLLKELNDYRRQLQQGSELKGKGGEHSAVQSGQEQESRNKPSQQQQQQQQEQKLQVQRLAPVSDDNLFAWTASIAGSPGSPYSGGLFDLAIQVPDDYPMRPPSMRFTTAVCHPNVHFKTGEICLDLLKSAWSPAWTLQSACLAVGVLLTSPEPDSPLNCDAANLLRAGDVRGYNSLVRMYTQLHAQ